ncbi:IPT/TIG domain-containing protein [Rhodohalobacter sp. 8-1]|uniref:IPT/TIG domain-containing protein n=1 Tax=Rhodohalobacter sp. 8-1 TaxID=3131972 RepID=UPI0030EC9060
MKQSFLIVIVLGMVSMIGCNGESSSLYDPNYEPERPDPIISNIEPEGGWLGGVDEVIITGENFSDVEEENRIYFNGEIGTVNSASQTEIRVRPAVVTGENVPVRMAVRKALNFSNTIEYQLDPAVIPAPGSIGEENVLGIATDISGNIYYSYQDGDGIPRGVRRWNTENNSVEQYITSRVDWISLKVGPDDLIYATRNNRAIYRETDQRTIDTNPFAIGANGEAFRDIDFDPDDNLWAVGDNDNIFRINITTGAIERFPFAADLRAVRYYDGKLYMGGRFDDGSEAGSLEIWTMDVSDGEANNPQQLLNLTEVAAVDFTLFTLTFDSSGTLFIGADTGTGIYTWSEGAGLQEFYPGLIEPTAYAFAWHDNFLVASATKFDEDTRFALKIDVRRQGAPYYGIE